MDKEFLNLDLTYVIFNIRQNFNSVIQYIGPDTITTRDYTIVNILDQIRL